MGQAVVDLPDPLEKQAGNTPSPDDLLAQLAGEEIDRLLAEADVDRPRTSATPPPVKPTAPATAPAQDPLPEAASPVAELSAAERTSAPPADDVPPVAAGAPAASAVPAAPSARGAAGADDPVLQAQLDDLFAKLTESVEGQPAKPATPAAPPAPSPAADPAPAADPPAAAVATSAAPAAQPPSSASAEAAAPAAIIASPEPASAAATKAEAAAPVPSIESASSPVERQALTASLAEALDQAVETDAAAGADDDTPLALWLRPLEWLNAPLANCTPSTRQAMGKIAIITLVNALAILVYVLLFRR